MNESIRNQSDIEIREAVRERYGRIASTGSPCCSAGSSCCTGTEGGESPAAQAAATPSEARAASEACGYTTEQIGSLPEGSHMGLGCGNPLAMSLLREGDTVLDLGSGGGIDCFLAAKRVGESGTVIGVDMTPTMIEKARANAERGGYGNVEFRLGEIENLPVADSQADLIISNCVINLSVNKARVFEEAFRVLKPGGRLAVSDIVLSRRLPEEIRRSLDAYSACIAGALLKEDYLRTIREAGFEEVRVESERSFAVGIPALDGGDCSTEAGYAPEERRGAATVLSIGVSAGKPSLQAAHPPRNPSRTTV